MKKIGFKVAAAIMVLALISIISLGFLANSMTTITASSQDVMNNEVEKINLIHGIYEDYLDISMNVYAHVNAKLVRTMLTRQKDVEERRAQMWESMNTYETMINSDEVREIYDSLRNRLESFDTYVDTILAASLEGNKETANSQIANNLGMLNNVIDRNMNSPLEFSAADLDTSKDFLQKKRMNPIS